MPLRYALSRRAGLSDRADVPIRRRMAGEVLNIGSKTKRLALPLSRISNPTTVIECPAITSDLTWIRGGQRACLDVENRLAGGLFCKFWSHYHRAKMLFGSRQLHPCKENHRLEGCPTQPGCWHHSCRTLSVVSSEVLRISLTGSPDSKRALEPTQSPRRQYVSNW